MDAVGGYNEGRVPIFFGVEVDLNLERRRNSAASVCDALFDHAIALKTSMYQNAVNNMSRQEDLSALFLFEDQLRKLIHQDWVVKGLKSLDIHIPDSTFFGGGTDSCSEDGDGNDACPPWEESKLSLQTSESGRVSVPSPALQFPPRVIVPRQVRHNLWRAVHVGDIATVKAIVEQGMCNGRTRDASGHSVLWHAIAFHHFSLAKYMLDMFPPGSDNGVDVWEVHQRRKETLFHLLCQSRNFGADSASIFKRIAKIAPTPLFEQLNLNSLTFLQIAAALLNFWVLKFVCFSFPNLMKAFVCSGSSDEALHGMIEVVARPIAPTYTPPHPMPEHFALTGLLSHDTSGKVLFADVAFDVGKNSSGDPASAGRFLAHRIVIAAQSPMLLEELERLSFQPEKSDGAICVFKVDPQISKEVWRSVLQFLYTGTMNCLFEFDSQRLTELLGACTLYGLPKPLLDFAQTALFPLLATCPVDVALRVFLITAGACAQSPDVRGIREAAAHRLLCNAPQIFQDMDALDVSKVLESVIQTVEYATFNPSKRINAQQEGVSVGGISFPPRSQPMHLQKGFSQQSGRPLGS